MQSTPLRSLLALGALALASQALSAQCTIDQFRSLLIKDLSVVEDPVRTTCCAEQVEVCHNLEEPLFLARAGAWTFGRLIEYMSGRTHPSDFIQDWLDQLRSSYTINGFVYNPDPAKVDQIDQLEAKWREASGGPDAPLDPCKAPFRLLAIVNRMDLNEVTGTGGYGNPVSTLHAGEGRFVFGLFDQFDPDNPLEGPLLEMSVIFEYRLNADSCEEVKRWAKRWARLSSMSLGDPCFNEWLQDITDDFSGPNTDLSRPNGNSLNQLRTNEFLVGEWEMREFNIVLQNASDNYSGLLRHVTTKQTPDNSRNNTAQLDQWLRDPTNYNQYGQLPMTTIPTVPDFFAGSGFMGGKSLVPFAGAHWDTPNFTPSGAVPPAIPNPGPPGNADTTVYHHFALQTCNGCHRDETNILFYMIRPRDLGTEAPLASFLTGIGSNAPDPREPAVVRSFNDLANRASIFCNLLNLRCRTACSEGSLDELQVQGQSSAQSTQTTSVLVEPTATESSTITFGEDRIAALVLEPCDVLKKVSDIAKIKTH